MRWEFAKPYLIIFAFSCLAMLEAYTSFYGGHDATIHGLWAKHFAQLLSEGHILPRFADDLNMGFGSFVFFFYPPLSLYFDSIFVFLGKDSDFYYDVIKASGQLAIFVSGVTCYHWLKNKTTNALICALIYMTLPVHLLLDYYVTAVISQLWCYAWFPLIMFGSEKISEDNKYGYLLLSFSAALLFLTNIPMTIIFPPFAFVYGMVMAKKVKHIALIIAAWLSGMILSAFYLLPVFAYKNLVNIDLHWSGPQALSYNNFFLDQKIFSQDAAEFHRFITFLCFLLTVVFAAMLLTLVKKSRVKTFLIISCLLCSFACFSISKPLWDVLEILQKTQFPRRLLVIPTIIIPLAACNLDKKRLKVFLLCNFIFLFMMTGIKYNRLIDLDKNMYAAKQDIFRHDLEIFGNYFPSKDVLPYFYNYPLNTIITNYPKVTAPGIYQIIKWQSRDIELNISGTAGDQIIIRQFYFPGWQAKIGDQDLKITSEEKFKILKITLPQTVQNKLLKIIFEKLPAEIHGMWISLIGFVLWLGLLIKKYRTHAAL